MEPRDKRLHYELARVVNHEDGTAIHQVKSLSRAEYESVSEASNLLTELFRGFNIYVRISLDNLEEEIVAGNRRLSAESKLDYTDKSRLLYMALCVSVAIKMYEEHVHSGINRRWGKESIQSKEARRLFSLTFDDSLEYRVMYALRNALAHSSTEVLNLKYSGRLSDPNDCSSDPVTSIKIGLSRTAFANADVRAETKREVARLAEDPDLLEYSRAAVAQVELLNTSLQRYIHPDVEGALRSIWATVKPDFESASVPPMFFVHEGDGIPTEWLQLPDAQWHLVTRHMKNACNE
jgi:hypothetical protein